ncbi:MAG: hypothetical protein B6244_11005 [Candidatus Cloacimonetes bacterium 4572_55]|nr:MAG: hypothetical protein B6244_11005 [Candidatus Cloacimonetes bacterium 4572_55]
MFTKRLVYFIVIFSVYIFSIQNLGANAADYAQIKAERADDMSTRTLSPSVGNAFIQAFADDVDGQFLIGTQNGEELLYGFPSSPWTSHTIFRIDDQFYCNNDRLSGATAIFADNQAIEDNNIVTAFHIGGVEIVQRLTPVGTSDWGAILIHYEITNTDNAPHDIGMLLELDTMIGSNDAAPLLTNSGLTLVETGFSGYNIPSFWQAFHDDNYDPNQLIGQGTIEGYYGGVHLTPPDFLVVGQWRDFYRVVWDYTPDGEPYGDSAVLYRWEPKIVDPGETLHIATLYGVGTAAISSGQFDLIVSAPSELGCVGGQVSPNPFEINLIVRNSSPETLNNATASITLDSGLFLNEDTQSKLTSPANIPPGEVGVASWSILAANPNEDVTLTSSIHVEMSSGASNSIATDVFIPACERNTQCYAYAIHDEGASDTQIFTIDINNDYEVSPLGEMHEGYDIEGMEIHPATGKIFASAGSHNVHGTDGYLFTIDPENGELEPIGYTGFNEITALSFSLADNTLWGWSEGAGLIRINTITAESELLFPSDINIEGLAWNNEGNKLYASSESHLYVYDSVTGDFEVHANNLPGSTEALEMRRDGYLMGSIHQSAQLSIFAYDVETMTVLVEEDITTPYNDIESIAWPDWCEWDIHTRCMNIYANRYNYVTFGWELALPSMEDVFASLGNDLQVVVSNNGGTYIPGTINTIGNAIPGHVYQVFAAGSESQVYNLCVIGEEMTSPAASVLNPNQWSWVASTCPNPILVQDYFADILDQLVIVSDDTHGFVYIPGLINTINYMLPNVGYKVYTTLNDIASLEIDCSARATVFDISESNHTPQPEYFDFTATGQSYTIVIQDGPDLESGSEIGLFDGDICVGAVVTQGDFPLAIPAWKASPDHNLPGYVAGQPIAFKVRQNSRTIDVKAEFELGDSFFGSGPFAKVSLLGESSLLHGETTLQQNYPNPFNPSSTIGFNLSTDQHVTLKVYNAAGQLITTLVNECLSSGRHEAVWNSVNNQGENVGSGVYFYRLQTSDGVDEMRKMVLMK